MEMKPLWSCKLLMFHLKFGKYYSKLGCFCFEKQDLKAGEKATICNDFLFRSRNGK